MNGVTVYQNGLRIDNKLRSKNGNVVRYFLTDHLGSTVALADSSGAIVSSTSYDSFGNAASKQAVGRAASGAGSAIPKQAAGSAASSAGNAASSTGSAVPNIATSYRYTGREYDADIGLYYYRNRWYDPEVGRFISEDPVGFAGGDINLYGYVWNNPQSWTDPSGNYACRKRQDEEQTDCDLETPNFGRLRIVNSSAYGLLNNAYGKRGARAQYLGFSTYGQAVLLNTAAAVFAQGVDLSNAKFEGFYNGYKSARPYGIYVSGVSSTDLRRAGLLTRYYDNDGKSYRPSRKIKEGSLEATSEGDEFAFDVDLHNPFGGFVSAFKHIGEVLHNKVNKVTTHPGDVAKALRKRGIVSGVRCRRNVKKVKK